MRPSVTISGLSIWTGTGRINSQRIGNERSGRMVHSKKLVDGVRRGPQERIRVCKVIEEGYRNAKRTRGERKRKREEE